MTSELKAALRRKLIELYNESRHMGRLRTGSPVDYMVEGTLAALQPEIERLESSARADELKKIERLLDAPRMPNSGTVEGNMRAWIKDRLALTQSNPQKGEL